jgi:hypothetical protein
MRGWSSRAGRLGAALLLTLPAGLDAAAWSPETRVRMVDEAVRFMPAALRTALQHYREPLLHGVLDPLTGEDGPEHRPPWAGGRLDQTLGVEIGALIRDLEHPTPFADAVRHFGRVAHYVLDASFPPGASRGDGAAHYMHFAAFCESRRERFPLVFTGHAEPHLTAGEWAAFATELLRVAGDDDRELSRAYAAAGDPPDPAAFDDRSVPFAIGSLSYSRGVTEIVRVWLAAWQRVDGDMAATPYWEPAPAPARDVH